MLDINAEDSLRFCDRSTRRQVLQAGSLGTMGLSLPRLLQSQVNAETLSNSTGNGFGQAKRVILLFMWGGPAHQDTWDLKPDGPKETRGEFLPISTNVPGIHISEHFPLLARHAEKLAIIRSVGQEDNNHSTGAHAGLTGRKHETKAENFAARQSDFPHFGSVLSKLNPSANGLPTAVSLPDIIATTNGTITPGQTAGILGRKYDPFQIGDHPDHPDFSIESLKLPQGLSLSRMQDRRGLLQQIDRVAKVGERSRQATALNSFYEQALGMVLSPEARRAFDLSSISDAERWRYGWHCFGQSTLLARRLIESGVKLVTVYWHREKKTVDSSWDTHHLNFQEMKNRLMPSVDRPIAALLEDLQRKGLLDETLVVWNSEFGRTPRINKNAGRDHWGPCNSVVMAGGGIPGGQVFGASDAQAAYPISEKVTQDDIAATIYHLLGYTPETPIHDRLNRPFPVALGEPIHKLLGGNSRPEATPAPKPLPIRPFPGPFRQMLIDRGGRFLCCELGTPHGDHDWQLTGFAAASDKPHPHRQLGTSPATISYTGYFHGHFDYSHLVLHLAEAMPLTEILVVANGSKLKLPTDNKTAPLWQIAFPPGFLTRSKTFTVTLTAPGWKLRDVALIGDPIRERHSNRV